ncbi:MarR family winged helix-turn-helix transcriptional regulator [Actinoallomurus sp. NPDC050550]|uniref:MarR family winged helix-turn-helix transcriptional regulator n=1 Tax=Actinoallomurus sp. NPDC050550 TaxID=3154937 RepID=UPI0033DAAD87
MDERAELVRRLDSAVQVLRHGRFGLYGPVIRDRFLGGLPDAVSPTGYRVLRFIEVSSPPPPSVSDVAAMLLVDRARAVRVVDRLAADGLVARVRDDLDRRIRRVALTEDGHRHLRLAGARRAELLGEALSDWSGADLEHLAAYLERLNDSVVRHLPWPEET